MDVHVGSATETAAISPSVIDTLQQSISLQMQAIADRVDAMLSPSERHRRTAVKLCVRTWNVCATPPPSCDQLRALLRTPRRRARAADAVEQDDDAAVGEGELNGDVYAIALQEVVDINGFGAYAGHMAYSAFGGGDAAVDGLNDGVMDEVLRWQHLLFEVLSGYKLVARKALVGMTIFVFVRFEHLPFCNARVSALGTGPLGLGNKGAVAVSLQLYGSSLCLVGVHLASGTSGTLARNEDVGRLHERLRFPDARTIPGLVVRPPGPATIGEHEFVVWLGDMNYRIRMADEGVRRAMTATPPPLAELAAADELRFERLAGRVFAGYEEAPLLFAPTYKYDRGTDVYDTSHKKRAPAWCDRILWRESELVALVSYGRCEQLKSSDHRPVTADLELYVAHEPSRASGTRVPASEHAGTSRIGVLRMGPPSSLLQCFTACLGVADTGQPEPGWSRKPPRAA